MEIIRFFSVKMLNFLWRSGASSPEPPYTHSTELLALVFGGRPANVWKKLKWQEEK